MSTVQPLNNKRNHYNPSSSLSPSGHVSMIRKNVMINLNNIIMFESDINEQKKNSDEVIEVI
ncbi:hypothetical protein M153_307000192 [Pseudoloma neurophilia]|uniref:Uncharacterized protein n=1 Tax=Pseudoloma neurophilia TaxID=146866 RepID=A0A0R0M3X4_9MICR|nr:hypothetical protein M153_307000192 [Pseudoloma neurophilia]